MHIATRRRLFLWEFWLLVVPYGVIAILCVALTVASLAVERNLEAAQMLAVAVAAFVPVFVGFDLSWRYVTKGVDSLVEAHWLWWLIAGCGAAVPIASAALILVGLFVPMPLDLPPPERDPFGLAPHSVSEAVMGGLLPAPLLIPFFHLLIERRTAQGRSRAEASSTSDRPR